MIILVCGSRDFDDYDLVGYGLSLASRAVMTSHDETTTLRHGGCSRKYKRGGRMVETSADLLAEEWVRRNKLHTLGWEIDCRKADWGAHGRAAGPVRNEEMLEPEKPDIAVAYLVRNLLCRGTRDMMRRLEAACVTTLVITR